MMIYGVKQYVLLEALTVVELERLVNELLASSCGWQIHGFTFFANAGYRQAMVRI